MAHKHLLVEIAQMRDLTPRIREYRMVSANRKPLPIGAPGAHIALYTGTDQTGPIVRHYSLIGGADERNDARNSYRIAVLREEQGRGSAFIHANFEVGTRLQISAPVNNFPLDRRDTHSVLIAGGIGITPIFSMARSLAHRRRPYTLVYAARDAQSMAYRPELLHMSGSQVHFHESKGGRMDLAALLKSQPADASIYVCGPAGMVEAARAAALAANFAPEQVRSEQFGIARTGDEVAFDVELRRSGRVLHIVRDVSILDVLNAAKIDVLWDCRRGECGLCPQTVIEADGPIAHRDRYLTDEERVSGTTMCVCVSRIRGKRLVLDA
jgi:ferredoxin-NADP reductase